MSQYKIAVLPGDAIGPEITREAVKVLKAIEAQSDLSFELNETPFGASAYFECGHPFPEQTIAVCDAADAILKGPIGLSLEETKKIPPDLQPERAGLLAMRQRYNTYSNIRPVSLPKALAHFSPLRPEVIGDGVDIVIIRELVGGLYFGSKTSGVNEAGLRYVSETLDYDEQQISQILHQGFQVAMRRKKKLHSIHKSNVLKSSVLWTELVEEIAPQYPEVEVVSMLVDAAATHLCINPCQFDVMVMENMFGDILSDLGGGILGSLGLMPSACLGPDKAYYEPSHGSAPDIAGQNSANPYSMIGSVAMMLEYSFNRQDEAKRIWDAMQSVFDDGYTTPDLARGVGDIKMISTSEFGDRVVAKLG